jgi:hypothetical protein
VVNEKNDRSHRFGGDWTSTKLDVLRGYLNAYTTALKKTGEIPKQWEERLDVILGTHDWYEAFFEVSTARDLFGDEIKHVEKASMESIGRFFLDRLKGIFAGVADNPGVLSNSKGNPMFLFCFAVSNQKGCGPALKIANYLLEGIR